jgi:hypothetical protein
VRTDADIAVSLDGGFTAHHYLRLTKDVNFGSYCRISTLLMIENHRGSSHQCNLP